MAIDESSLWKAVHRMEAAGEQMSRAAEQTQQAVRELRALLNGGEA